MIQVNHRLIVITAAYNEVESIAKAITSMLSQTVRPKIYYVVSDGSTDGTDEIIKNFAAQYDFVKYVRREKPSGDFSRTETVSPGKVGCIRQVLNEIFEDDYEFLGILDADIVLPNNYYERILEEFSRNPQLGIAACFLRSILPDGSIAPGGFFNEEAAGGPVQVFRRECYQQIGGYVDRGHEDCVAAAMATKHGWMVRSFADMVGDHYVPASGYEMTISSKVPMLYRMGKLDYIMSVPFWFVVIQSAIRSLSYPIVIGGGARVVGYCAAVIRREDRAKIFDSRRESYRHYFGLLKKKVSSVIG